MKRTGRLTVWALGWLVAGTALPILWAVVGSNISPIGGVVSGVLLVAAIVGSLVWVLLGGLGKSK
ncbi:MAG TPA: hypothetical protein VHL34_03535 [Rhizomicrobium sp.]|jgi:hypothetical protein|nr:hypothetical protein [Rhizomicrobium sp.]